MRFTLALSRVLVAAGNRWCWHADDANITAVTGDAAVWIGGFKTVPTRQAVCTTTACCCNLTLTLTSNLWVRHAGGEREVWTSEGKNMLVKRNKGRFVSFPNSIYFIEQMLSYKRLSFHQKCACCCVVYLGTLRAAVDCPSSMTVTRPTHINWSGIRFVKPEKSTYTQLTVLTWQWETQRGWDREKETTRKRIEKGNRWKQILIFQSRDFNLHCLMIPALSLFQSAFILQL